MKGAHIYDETFFEYLQISSKRSAQKVVPLVLKHLQPDSILDVGCGAGAWLSQYVQFGNHDVVGVDGDYVQTKQLLIAPELFKRHDVSQPFDIGRRFSLVQCLEVGEHIPTAQSQTLVDNLVKHGDRVLFSAALPGQGGENHINEQSFEFWRDLFERRGFFPYDFFRPLLRTLQDVEPWYRHNVLLYVRESAAGELPDEIRAAAVAQNQPIVDVSPWPYRIRKMIIGALPIAAATKLAIFKHRLRILVN